MTDRDNITLPREVVQEAVKALEFAERNHDGEQSLYTTEIAALRTALAAPSEDIDALRRDAERYRWLRDNAAGFSGRTLDAAIDAAMQEDKT